MKKKEKKIFPALIRLFSKISVRMLIFNSLLVFLPVAGLLYLDTYEQQMLKAQENSMVQQGRIISAALSEQGGLDAVTSKRIIEGLRGRAEARIRVLDTKGILIADSSRIFAQMEQQVAEKVAAPEQSDSSPEKSNWFYELVTAPVRLYRKYFMPPKPAFEYKSYKEYYSSGKPFMGPEVTAALEGKYGAITRLSTGGQKSVTLYSAIPIRDNSIIIGVILVSQSTYRILQNLYEIRLGIFKIFLASIIAALIIGLLLSVTIAWPLKKLRNEAEALLDRRGRLKKHFVQSRRKDEIGDLSHSLGELTRRLEKHISFIESFAADLSHEFKNPLAAMRSATEIALETNNPGEKKYFLNMVRRDIARMERLLTGAREISRIDTEIVEKNLEEIELRELLTHIVTGFKIRVKEIEFIWEPPDRKVIVMAAIERLAQVFENLLDNAVSFSRNGDRIRISTDRREGEIFISICDSGPGIPEENLDLIFNRFFSFRPGEEKKSLHTGLGLSVVKAIIENFSGSVNVLNRREGGAAFIITLPVVR